MHTMGRGWSCLVLGAGLMLSISFAGEEAETPLDREARAQAAQFYRRYLTKCDADYFYFTVERAKSPPVVEEWILYQLHGLNIVVNPFTLSEAERLNGLEWRGSGSVFTEAFRIYDVTRQTWRPDRQGRVWMGSMQVTPLEIMLKKQQGQWTITSPSGQKLDPPERHVDCTQLPKE